MRTEVITIDAVHPEPALIERATALLHAGHVVVFPTETVYGLGADAFQSIAVEGIFAAKGRPFNDPLIVHIAEGSTLSALTTTPSAVVNLLSKAFWPGPLTLIVPRGQRVPTLVTAGLDTVAVRMPRHPVALALIRAVGSPLAAPSANRFMHTSPTTAQHALADLAGRVPLILDGGPCEVGVESTVLDLCAEVPTILRPGGISLEALRKVLPNIRYTPQHTQQEASGNHSQKSPGQLLTHYTPAVPLLLYDGSIAFMRSAILEEVRQRQARLEIPGVLIADEDIPIFEGSGAFVQTVGSAAEPEKVAAALFAGMRALESAGVHVILCRSFDERGLGLAIRDRLLKAAGGRVLYEQ